MTDETLCRIRSAVERERRHQDRKHGTIEEHPHSVGEWLLIMEKELREAKDRWFHFEGNPTTLREVLQVVATGFACMGQHGIHERES